MTSLNQDVLYQGMTISYWQILYSSFLRLLYFSEKMQIFCLKIRKYKRERSFNFIDGLCGFFCLCYSIPSELVFPRAMVACFELHSDLFTYAIVQIFHCIGKNGESENGISIGASKVPVFHPIFATAMPYLCLWKTTYSNRILRIL